MPNPSLDNERALQTYFGTPHWHERQMFFDMGMSRLSRTDLFSHSPLVVPVKTEGRTYGVLSRIAAERWGEIPRVAYACTEVREHAGVTVVYLAFWKDDDATHQFGTFAAHVIQSTRACVMAARRKGIEKLWMPVLGGNRWEDALPLMEWTLEATADEAEERGVPQPDVSIVRI